MVVLAIFFMLDPPRGVIDGHEKKGLQVITYLFSSLSSMTYLPTYLSNDTVDVQHGFKPLWDDIKYVFSVKSFHYQIWGG